MAENRRKSENIRRANRVIQTRTFVLMLVLGVAVFLVLALKLYQLQIKQHDYYQSKALDQQTRSTVVTASRGTIYDRNGNELAVSATAEYTSTPSFSASFWPLIEMEAGAAVTPTGAAAASVL